MASQRLPNQRDIDSQILELGPNPLNLFWGLVLIFTVFIFIGSTLALFGAMAAGFIQWAIWPFVAIPTALWAVMLALPIVWSSRRGALAILDALATSAEAWLARAGYSIDLNGDGYIGAVTPQFLPAPEPVEEIRPILIRNGESKLLAHQEKTIPNIAEGIPVEEEAPEARLQMSRKVWQMPSLSPGKPGLKVPQETIEDFIDGIFIHGVGRGYWVPKFLDRDTYDSLILLLEQARLLTDRKPGFAGRLMVSTSRRAKLVLKLVAPGGN